MREKLTCVVGFVGEREEHPAFFSVCGNGARGRGRGRLLHSCIPSHDHHHLPTPAAKKSKGAPQPQRAQANLATTTTTALLSTDGNARSPWIRSLSLGRNPPDFPHSPSPSRARGPACLPACVRCGGGAAAVRPAPLAFGLPPRDGLDAAGLPLISSHHHPLAAVAVAPRRAQHNNGIQNQKPLRGRLSCLDRRCRRGMDGWPGGAGQWGGPCHKLHQWKEGHR
ncbi:hypothetical protein ZWY2020_037181 [Hordeum vulgare]|nr:hypothetical protein ZWY2020_037181 [Hordeum vulgare]